MNVETHLQDSSIDSVEHLGRDGLIEDDELTCIAQVGEYSVLSVFLVSHAMLNRKFRVGPHDDVRNSSLYPGQLVKGRDTSRIHTATYITGLGDVSSTENSVPRFSSLEKL